MKKYLFVTLFVILVLLGNSFAQVSNPRKSNNLNFKAVPKGRTYYVKNSGNDTLDGLSEATAWKTLAKIQSTSFKPGDTIYLKRGDTWAENLSFSSSGELFNEITLGAYGSGDRPIINRLRFYVAKKYVTVKSIEMHNSEGTGIMFIQGGNNFIIDDCILDGLHKGTADLLLIVGYEKRYARDILIKNSTFKNAGQWGNGYGGGVNVVGLSRRVTVDNCTFIDNGEFGVQIYSGDPEKIPSELKVTGCYIVGAEDDYDQGSGVNIGWYAKDCIVENNYIVNNRVGMAIDHSVTGTNIYRNNTVYNSIELCTISGGTPESGSNAKILNNTLIAGPKTLKGVWFMGPYGGTGNVLKNNTIVMQGKWFPSIRIDPAFRVDSDHNNFYNPTGGRLVFAFGATSHYNTIEDWRRATGQDINSTITITP